jgi:hypothetical protein
MYPRPKAQIQYFLGGAGNTVFLFRIGVLNGFYPQTIPKNEGIYVLDPKPSWKMHYNLINV